MHRLKSPTAIVGGSDVRGGTSGGSARLWALAAVIAAAGLALRLYRLDYQSVWYDEAFSIVASRQPLADLLQTLIEDFVQPPLHYFLLHAVLSVRDTGSMEARLLSACLGAAAVPMLFFAGRALLDRTTGLIAAMLLAVSQLAVMYSQEVRPYALQQLLVCTALLWFGLAARTREPRYWWAFVLSAVLAVYSHYYSLFFLIPLFGYALFGQSHLPRAPVLAGGAVLLLLLAPWFASGIVDAALSSQKTVGDQPSWFSVSWNTPLNALNSYNNGNIPSLLTSGRGPGLTYLLGTLLLTTPVLIALGSTGYLSRVTSAQLVTAHVVGAAAFAIMGLAAGADKSVWLWGLSCLLLFRAAQIVGRMRHHAWSALVTSEAAWVAMLMLAAILAAFQSPMPSILGVLLGVMIGHSLHGQLVGSPAAAPNAGVGRAGMIVCLAAASFLPVSIPIVFGYFGVQYNVRYTLAALPAYYLLAAHGLSLIRPRKWQRIAVSAALGYSLFALRANYFEPYKENWRDGLALLADGYRQGDCVSFLPWGDPPLEWRVYGYDKRQPVLNVISPERLDDMVPSCSRVWLLSYGRIGKAVEKSDALEQSVALTHREAEHHDLHWVEVGVYERRD